MVLHTARTPSIIWRRIGMPVAGLSGVNRNSGSAKIASQMPEIGPVNRSGVCNSRLTPKSGWSGMKNQCRYPGAEKAISMKPSRMIPAKLPSDGRSPDGGPTR